MVSWNVPSSFKARPLIVLPQRVLRLVLNLLGFYPVHPKPVHLQVLPQSQQSPGMRSCRILPHILPRHRAHSIPLLPNIHSLSPRAEQSRRHLPSATIPPEGQPCPPKATPHPRRGCGSSPPGQTQQEGLSILPCPRHACSLALLPFPWEIMVHF